MIVHVSVADPGSDLKSRLHCPGVRPGASRQFGTGGPGRTGTTRDIIRVPSFISGNATVQTRFEAKLITVCPGYATVCYCSFPE